MNYLFSPLMIYFSRHALLYYFFSITVLSFIVCLSELIEYNRLTSHIDNTNFLFSLKMTLLKMPLRIQDLLPYAIFFGSIISLLKLSKNSELIIARTSGLNMWYCSLPHILIAFLIGIISISVFSTITSVTQKKLIQIEGRYLDKNNNSLQISNGGFWLYQKEKNNTAIIHAESIDPINIELKNIIIFRYNENDEFYERIDGDISQLERGYWKIKNGKKTDKNLKISDFIELQMPTYFTSSQIKESFAPPETVSFWSMLNFIEIIEKSGFSSRKHKIYWYSMLATPFLLIGMALMGTIFAIKPLGRNGIGKRIFIATIIAFIVFFLNDVIAAIGQRSDSPALISAWAPKLIPIIISASIILYLEDG